MVLYKITDETEINNAPISTSLLAKLQRDILTGSFRPGQKLTEQDLCKRYGVSRTPVREALRQLEEGGLVENIMNRSKSSAKHRKPVQSLLSRQIPRFLKQLPMIMIPFSNA